MLQRYATFLNEAKKPSKALSQKVSSDTKGKLHELLLGKHLHPDKKIPEHFAAKNKSSGRQESPVQVHDKLKAEVGHEVHREIEGHAADTAAALHQHLKDEGHIKPGENVGSVHWTSNRDTHGAAGDHEKLTGIKDVNSNADLIVGIHKNGKHQRYVGVSAKYGVQEPNYKNSGAATLEKDAGLKSGSLGKQIAPHHKRMEAMGYTGVAEDRHRQWKADLMLGRHGIDHVKGEHAKLTTKIAAGGKVSLKDRYLHKALGATITAHKAAKDKDAFVAARMGRAKAAEESALTAKRSVAKAISGGFAKKTDAELRTHIQNTVSPPTHIPHIVAHSKVQSDGSSVPHVQNAQSITSDHLKDIKKGSLHVTPHAGGVTIKIAGEHKSGEKRRVAEIGLKSGSGPSKFGPVGVFGLPKYAKDKK